MMNRQEVIALCVAAAKNQASANFTATDIQDAARNALVNYIGCENMELTGRTLREHRNDLFAIIEEVVDNVVPQKMTDILGKYAEIKSFGRNDQVKFKVSTLGGNRVKMAIVPGARGGVYRARRLDNNDLYLDTHVETIGYMITLEELLTVAKNLSDIVSLIAEGLVEKVWIEVVKALRAAYATVPAKNKATATGDTIDLAGIDKIIRTIGAYGKPVILGFSSLIDQISNKVGFNGATPNLPNADLDDIRNMGYVGLYKGIPVIKLPNYLVDESNTEWVFKETDIFVLPSDQRPVKVAFQGDSYTSEVDQPHGGKEWHLHKIMGVGILFYNTIGIYRQTAATGLDAEGLY